MIRRYILLGSLLFASAASSIIDNRYFPLYARPSVTKKDYPSKLGFGVYFVTADEAKNSLNRKIGIPELWGKFDQIKASSALALVGKTNPLDPQFALQRKLEWDWSGKISGQGAHFGFERPIGCNVSLGVAWDLMHVQSRNDFEISSDIKTDLMKLPAGKLIQLEQERRQINTELGLASGVWSKTGLSDLDVYLKYSWLRDYCWKFKRVDASAAFGVLAPTSVKRDLDNPASVPFGGDGHTGLYLLGALNLELKEDWFFGLSTTFLQRLPKTMERRMPANNEPVQYGVVKGLSKVKPGFTFGFSAFFEVQDFWDWFGLRGSYSMVAHTKDNWIDSRADQSIAVTLGELEKHSNWISEYLGLGFVCNLNSVKQFKKFEPKLYLNVDVPTHFFLAKNTCRTTRVSVGMEASF